MRGTPHRSSVGAPQDGRARHPHRMLTFAPTPTLVARSSPLELLRAGDVPHAERAVADGRLVRVRRGVYAPADRWWSLRPWERYLVRVHAVAATHPGSVFSHESAAVLWGMPVIGDPVVVHILVDPSSAAREHAGVRAHRVDTYPDVISDAGMLIVSPASVAVTVARHRHEAIGLAAADAALRLEPSATAALLVRDNETRSSSRGRRHARWALERADGARESVLESVSAAAIEWLGFPRPEFQHVFSDADGRSHRGDFWWPERRLVGEPDGEFKYDGRYGDPAALLRARHERDRTLIRTGADAVAHWGWIDVVRAWPLRRLLLGNGLAQVIAEDSGRLASLSRALRPYESLLHPRP